MLRALPRAVLLDLDDTILDDSGSVRDCWREACIARAETLGDLSPDLLFLTIERIGRSYWIDPERHRRGRLELDRTRCHIVELALNELGIGRPSLAHEIGGHYSSLRDRRIEPITDALSTVSWLRDQGCRLALVTNGAGPAQRRKIDRFEIAPRFDAVLIEGELGYGKPDARVYRDALAALEATASECWMIGDNLEWDVAQPQRLGIRGIWIDRKGGGLPEGCAVAPDMILRSLSEVRALVLNASRIDPSSFARS